MLLRFLSFVFLSYLFFVILKSLFSWGKRQRGRRSQERSTETEEMVLDPQCRSYLAKGEAILRSGRYFCSDECAKVYLARGKEKDEGAGMKDREGGTSL